MVQIFAGRNFDVNKFADPKMDQESRLCTQMLN